MYQIVHHSLAWDIFSVRRSISVLWGLADVLADCVAATSSWSLLFGVVFTKIQRSIVCNSFQLPSNTYSATPWRSIVGDSLQREDAQWGGVLTWCSEWGERFYAPETHGRSLCLPSWIVNHPLAPLARVNPLGGSSLPRNLSLVFTPILGISYGSKAERGWCGGQQRLAWGGRKCKSQGLSPIPRERPCGFKDWGGGRCGDPQCLRAPTVTPQCIHLCQAPSGVFAWLVGEDATAATCTEGC